jgi:hypothetical protein
MQDVEIFGVVTEKFNKYILTADDGTEYTLFAINPWESVPPEFGTGKFAKFIGERVKVFGRLSGTEIWNAVIHCPEDEDTNPPELPGLDDLGELGD